MRSIEANLFGTGRAAMKYINQRSIKNLSLILVIPFLAFGQSSPSSAQYEWRSYGDDPGGMRYSSLDQINRSNVTQLQRAWTYHTGEIALGLGSGSSRATGFQCTPLVV